nr:MAG TPA: hypothetical protein [Caudoviricetes sp.]
MVLYKSKERLLQRTSGMPLPLKNNVPYFRCKGILFFNTIKDTVNDF